MRKVLFKNRIWIVLVLAVLLLIPVIKRTIEKIKWEVAAYESRQVRK